MMPDEQKLLADLSSYLYKLESIKQMYGTSEGSRTTASFYTIYLFGEINGGFAVDGQKYTLHRNKVFLLPPHSSVQWEVDPDSATYGYQIEFSAYQPVHRQFAPVKLNLPVEWPAVHVQALIESAGEIGRKLGGSGWEPVKANILFQDMLIMLFDDLLHEPESMQDLAVAMTMDYMERNYSTNITREQLAEMAGMSADYYSRSFKKKNGKTPLEYLTDIRINHAKQSLILSRGSFRSIARSVGFNDEFYFSRKFKNETGISPSAFVNKMKAAEKIVSLHHHLTGHLIVLGIEPYAALINDSYPVADLIPNTMAIGHNRPNLEKLAAAQPDIIFTCESFDMETTRRFKALEQLAPTVTIPFFNEWRSQLYDIAKATGKEKEAGIWLEAYERKAASIRQAVQSNVKEDALLIIGVGNEKLCVFGRRNVGGVLYGDLQLTVPPKAADIDHYLELSYDEIFSYACESDRILFTGYKNDGSTETKRGIGKALQRLYNDSRWPELKAVRNNAVYSVLEHQHLYTLYTSYSHDLLLNKLNQLLTTDLSK